MLLCHPANSMPEPLNPKIRRWIERSVYRPGDSEDVLLLKRIHWISLNLANPLRMLISSVSIAPFGRTSWMLICSQHCGKSARSRQTGWRTTMGFGHTQLSVT